MIRIENIVVSQIVVVIHMSNMHMSLLQETVQNDTYLGLLKFRFYIRCPRCISEITFKVKVSPKEGCAFNFVSDNIFNNFHSAW